MASGELYRPVATRGIAANGIFLVTMGAFGAVNLALAAADPASRRATLEKMLAGAIDTAAANEDVEPAQALVAELTRRLHRVLHLVRRALHLG